MCLAIPGKVVELFSEGGLRMGTVDYGGTRTRVCLEYLPEIELGQYTVVHAGFGLSMLDEAEAMKSLAVWRELEDSVAESYGTDIFGNRIRK